MFVSVYTNYGDKTIGIRDDVYEQLKARKREDESFTDLMNRILDETTVDWREGFGTLSEGEADELEQIVKDSRNQTSEGLSARQQEVLDVLADIEKKMKLLDTTFLIHYWAGWEAVEDYLETHEEEEFVTTTLNIKEIAVGREIQGNLTQLRFRQHLSGRPSSRFRWNMPLLLAS